MATDDATYKRRTEVYSTNCLVTLPWWGNCRAPLRAPKARARRARISSQVHWVRGIFRIFLKTEIFFLRFQKNTHQHVAYSNRFCASLENVVSLEAAFLNVTLPDIQKTATRETM